MSKLLAEANVLAKAFRRLECFAKYEALRIPVDRSSGPDISAALSACEQSQDDLLCVACLLIGYHNGLLGTSELKRLSNLAVNFGLYPLALASSNALLARDLSAADRFDVSATQAKAHRGLGRYSDARSIYRALFSSAPDKLSRMRLLLQLAKVAHTAEWRIGYYRAMLHWLRANLTTQVTLAQDDEERQQLRYWLGVCYDSLAKVVLERSLDSRPIAASATAEAFQMLEEAVTIAREDGPQGSLQRRILRSYYLRFKHSSDVAERQRFAELFERTLDDLGTTNDPRGLGVRFGQLAEMQTDLGRLSDAADSCRHSVNYARRVSDWRALARNHLRTATLSLAGGRPFSDFLDELEKARAAISRLTLQHPEIEIEIEREAARQSRTRGRLADSRKALRRVADVLLRLERRVLEDFHLHSKPSDEYSPAEREVLGPAEWTQLTTALIFDYQWISHRLREVVEETGEIAKRDVRQEGIEAQLCMLASYLDGVAHRSKNVVALVRHDNVLGVVRELVSLHGDAQARGALATLERQLARVDELRAQADHDLALIADTSGDVVSMRQVASSLDLAFELTVDPDLILETPADFEESDFQLVSHEPLVRQALTHLVENAARIVRESKPPARRVTVRVSCVPSADGGGLGVLDVEDSAGRVEELERALRLIEGGAPTDHTRVRVSGLLLAHRFFGMFHGRFSVEPAPLGATRLRIEFPHLEGRVLARPRAAGPRPASGG